MTWNRQEVYLDRQDEVFQELCILIACLVHSCRTSFVECNLLTVQKIIGDKREKLKLAKKFKSISVIDMEAYYIKEELLKVNIPMLSFKVIFDDLSFDIPSYIPDCINDRGELKIVHFLTKLILKPKRVFELLNVNFKFLKSKKVLENLVNSF